MSVARAPGSDSAGTEEPVALRLSGIRKSYGGVEVLRDFNLEVSDGQRVAIIGRSGSGKTTVLRVVMGLEIPDDGEVLLYGRELRLRKHRGRATPQDSGEVRRTRRQVGMVFQHFNLFPHMTALSNVMEAPRRVLGMSKSEARQTAAELLTAVGLGDKLKRLPSQLSGGQQQRVAIARALAMSPRMMLFDEVTSALDPELVGEVLKVIEGLADNSNMTMLIVTHEMRFARHVADRVLFMEEGCIEEDGPPDQIFAAPKSERTRRFLRAVLDH